MLPEPNCLKRRCARFKGLIGEEEPDQRFICDAFPEGIPVEILDGTNLHLSSVDGDKGLLYVKAPQDMVLPFEE